MANDKAKLVELHEILSQVSVPLAMAAAQLADDAVPASGVVNGKLVGAVPPGAITMAPAALIFSESAAPVAKASAPLARAVPAL